MALLLGALARVRALAEGAWAYSPALAVCTAVVGIVVGIFSLQEAFFALHKRRLSRIPGPPGYPIVGHIPYLLSEPWMRFAEFSTRYGPLYKLWVWRKLFVVISEPALVKRVFFDKRHIYPKDQWSYKFFEDVLGAGLVTSEGAHWKQQRALLSPAFHFGALQRMQPLFEEASSRLVDALAAACDAPAESATVGSPGAHFSRSHERSWRPVGGGRVEVELSSTFRQVTLEVISDVALSLKPADASVFPALFEAVVDELNARTFQPWRAMLPAYERPHRRHIAELNGIVHAIIAARKALRAADPARYAAAAAARRADAAAAAAAAAATGDDIGADSSAGGTAAHAAPASPAEPIGDMLDLMLDGGVPLTVSQLTDEVKTQLLAGHETSSMMLTWTLYLLAANPAAMARAVAEVDAVLGLEAGVTQSAVPAAARRTAPPTFEDFRSLEYVGWALKEAMRLYTPVPVLNRESTAADELAPGFVVPAGTAVIVSVWAMHTSRAIWGESVADFRPERFSVEESRGRHAYAFIPFSQGPRNCIGQNLAIVEAKVVLGMLLRRFRITLAPGTEVPRTDCFVIPVRPAKRLHVHMERRN